MSIKVMTFVWDGFPGSGSELLAMLALADWCDDRGGSLYPSIKAVGDKIHVGENQARKILRKFEQDRYLAVVGNHNGGKPGTTREYRLNVSKLKLMADEANVKRDAEKAAKYLAKMSLKDDWDDVFLTPIPQDTPIVQDGPTAPLQDTPTAPLQHRDGYTPAPRRVHPSTETAPPQGGLTTIEPPIEPPEEPTSISEALSALPALVDSSLVVDRVKDKPADKVDTELQAACKATWQAYSIAYKARYGADPVRNAKVNTNVKDFVKRIGYDESPGVAAFYVTNINEVFVVRSCHALGTLLQNAEAYRTQWATGTSMTNTRARQIDQTQSNYSAVDEAIALMRARRAKIKAEGGSNE